MQYNKIILTADTVIQRATIITKNQQRTIESKCVYLFVIISIFPHFRP